MTWIARLLFLSQQIIPLPSAAFLAAGVSAGFVPAWTSGSTWEMRGYPLVRDHYVLR
jgi:hypothetical protein